MTKKISVIFADDHELMHYSINLILSMEENIHLAAEAYNGEQLIKLVELHNPDVVLIDVKMPVMDGIEATRIISKKYPHVGIIAISMFSEDHLIAGMLQAGASGYLMKNAKRTEILEAIHHAANNKSYFSKEVANKLAVSLQMPGAATRRHGLVSFTEKELMVLVRICQQYSTKEIALQLNLSVRTIEGYRERLFEKTGKHNMAGLAVYAMQHSIYNPQC